MSSDWLEITRNCKFIGNRAKTTQKGLKDRKRYMAIINPEEATIAIFVSEDYLYQKKNKGKKY